MITYSVTVGLILLVIFFTTRRPRIGANEPPLVPYTIPIIGHTYDYLFNTKNFVKDCRKKYGDCFTLYVFGSLVTIVSNRFMNEVFKSHDNFDLTSATNEILPLHEIFIYNGGVDRESMKLHAKATREQISGKLDSHLPIVQKYVLRGIDKWIGDCKVPKTISNNWYIINNIINLPIVNTFVGEEAASHEDLVKSFADLAFDFGPLVSIPPVFAFIHKKLHEFIITLPMRCGWNPAKYHRKVVTNRLRPVIEKRLKERIELGNDYKPYDDILEYYMKQPDFDYDNLLYHIDNLLVLDFAAVSTTSRAATNVLYDMAARPECLKELYEEALLIDKECNGSFTMSDFRKMKKLDSFIKESYRHTGDVAGLPHYVISEGHTFHNGLTIPKGRKINMYLDCSLKSKEAYGDDAEEFKPFRFLNKNSSATKVDRFYTVFGNGKHACPGRYFAVNETKLVLHKLILKYNISTKSGTFEKKVVLGPATLPPRGALVFENRK